MIPTHSLILFACSAPLAYLTLLFSVRARRELSAALYVPLAWGMASLTVVEVGWALCTSSSAGSVIAWGHSIALGGVNATLVPFAYTLHYGRSRPISRMTQLAWLWTLLGILLAASSLASDAGAILAMVPEGQPRTHVYTDLARMQGLGISVISCLLLAEDWKTRGNRRLTAFFIVATIPGVIAWLSLMSRDSVDSSTVYYPGLLLALTALSFSAFPVYLGLRREGELDAVSLRVRHDTATLSREKDTLRSVEPLATIGSLSQLIAHEIRNPLSSITNSVSALRTGALKQSEQQTLIRILDKEADHIERLTSDLLVYSAPPSDALVRTCLWSLIERALVVANERNDERVTEFIQERPDPLLSALVDVQLLSASVQRMIDSALDVLSDTDRIRVSLSDNSQNVPKTIALTVAVEPSSSFGEGSGPSVTNPIDGTGIRFSIVEKAATFHYGEVNFTSPPTGPWKMVMILPQDPPNQEDS